MGKEWDNEAIAFSVDFWREALRVLKPGAHILAFGSTRTYHRLASAIEDAGAECRDTLMWCHGQGFPKSLNLPGGIGTALKPAMEPIILARKPIAESSIAANVLAWGTGALNIAATRIQSDTSPKQWSSPRGGIWRTDATATAELQENPLGRWPANLVLDEAAAALLDAQSGPTRSAGIYNGGRSPAKHGFLEGGWQQGFGYADSGGPSRFFYVAKASRAERDAGCEAITPKDRAALTGRKPDSPGLVGTEDYDGNPYTGANWKTPVHNGHPTVKPIGLMRWLVRLITAPGQHVLDPFGGSGSTAVACIEEGRDYTIIEREAEYIPIIAARTAYAARAIERPARPSHPRRGSNPTPRPTNATPVSLWNAMALEEAV